MSAAVQTEGSVYVVPVNADGTAALQADGSYVGQVEMTTHSGETGISVRRIEIEEGFVFSAVSADGTKHTLYTSRKPVSFDSKNALSITDRVSDYIEVPAGVYDITFYRSTGSGSSFSIKQSATGFDDIEAENTAPAEYFDLSGRRVGADPAPGLYVERRGDQMRKVFVR